MNEAELSAAIEREIDNALGGDEDGGLSNNRSDAWKYFLGKPIGGEREGHSQVVSTDLAEVIDWVMPEVVRAFGSNEAAVEFAAFGKDDETQAENETKAVNHVFFKENTGLLILHNWFQEAFLQKNGYVKAYWDDTPEYGDTAEMEGLTDLEFQAVEQSDAADIVSEEILEIETMDPMTGQVVDAIVRNIVVREIKSKGRIEIKVIPSDEALVNKDHTDVSLKGARFSAHKRQITVSELIEMGVDRETAESLPSSTAEDNDIEDEARDLVEDYDDDEPADPSMRKVNFTEAVWFVDVDDDGIAERRFIQYSGKKFLTNDDADYNNMVAITALPISNKHLGRSLFDKIRQIADIKTALWRQVIDNLFLQNNTRHAVVEGQVNIRDILNNRAGGIVRQKQPGMIEPLKAPAIGQEAFQFIEYLDRVRTQRTGVGPEIVTELGQLANSTAWGVERLMSKKEELIGMMIAVFRSTGVNELFELIHTLLRENAEPFEIPVDGEWVQANPKEWRERKTVPAVTWSGMGDRIAKQKMLAQVMQIQEKLLTSPMRWMVSPSHVYESVSDMVRIGGVPNVAQYMFNPDSDEGKQAAERFKHAQQQSRQQDQGAQILATVEQIKGEYAKQVTAIKEFSKTQIERMKSQVDVAKSGAEQQRLNDELAYKYDELDQRFAEKMTAIEADLMKAASPRDIPEGEL